MQAALQHCRRQTAALVLLIAICRELRHRQQAPAAHLVGLHVEVRRLGWLEGRQDHQVPPRQRGLRTSGLRLWRVRC